MGDEKCSTPNGKLLAEMKTSKGEGPCYKEIGKKEYKARQ